MNNQKFITHIREHIANNQFDTALQLLRDLLDNSPQLDEVIQQAGRYASIRQQIRLGTVSHADATLTENQIRMGLIELLAEIEKQEKKPRLREEMERAVISIQHSKNVNTGNIRANTVNIGDKTEHRTNITNNKNTNIGTINAEGNAKVILGDTTTNITESKTSRRLRLFLFLFVPILAIGAAYFWYQSKVLNKPVNLKVRIENTTPNRELPNPVGTLALTYGTKTEAIENDSDNPEILFEEIPAEYKRKKLRLQYQAKNFISVDTLVLLSGGTFVLPVRRNNDLAILSGKIYDENGGPLEGVQVSITCCKTSTDKSGEFTLNIPFEHQRREQRLYLFKEGYKKVDKITPVFKSDPPIISLSKNK